MLMKKKKNDRKRTLKPIMLYDHLPGILAGYPALLFAVLAIMSIWPDVFNTHMMFWIGTAIMLVCYVAFRFNMPKGKFWLMFGLLGTFVGIPVALELTGLITPFQFAGEWLGKLAPEVNTGAWVVMSMIFAVICSAIWFGVALICVCESTNPV